ncbi:hypothetical protein N878_05305 [Pseudomonas sp. EGD-AK9]|nr:glycosyltransferase family 4 protein [Pseudomonas sp. EGD-AK9]ERI52239.1 hypothetical protein N878_05305 [Pseudomonas sp. EGD-AK9]
MERLNWHIADELSRRAEVRVIAPVGSAALAPGAVELTEVPLRPLWRFLQASAWQAARSARAWKPHIVLAGSGLTAPAALLAASATNARACVYLHGLDAAVKHPLYRALWHPAIRRMETVLVNSQPTADLARSLGVEEEKLRIVHPGVHIPNSAQTSASLQAFRQRHGLGNARVLLSIGRLTTRKGLREFVQHALPAIVRSAPDTMLVVIGDAPAESLHASVQSRESIQAAADAAGIGQNLRFLGVITDATELACAYECATLHVFPVRDLPGDPEGFGMVAIEAAAHGLPTVAYATGGVTDAVSQHSGRLVPPGDTRAFIAAVTDLLEHPMPTPPISEFSRQFAWPRFGERIRGALMITPAKDNR